MPNYYNSKFISKKKPLLFLSFTIMLFGCTNVSSQEKVSSNSGTDHRSIEQQITDHFISLEDNNTFPFFDKIVKGKRLIILGESSHYGAVTFQTKINMIRQLKEKYGFKVLALEGMSGVNSYLFNELQEKASLKDLQESWAEVWADTEECYPLLEMLHKKQIEYWGIEGVYHTKSTENSLKCIKTILDKYQLKLAGSDSLFSVETRKMWERLTSSWPISMPETSVMLNFVNHTNNLKNDVNNLLRKKEYWNNQDLKYILEIIKNIKSGIREFYIHTQYEKPFENDDAIVRLNGERDCTMARNLIWYMKQHPNKKVVLWCANFHGSRDITQAINSSDPTMYMKTQLLGNYLSDEFGDQMYSLAFTSSNVTPGRLEQSIAESNPAFGFIDFISIRERSEFSHQPFECGAINKKTGNWMYIWDGLYYIKEERRSTIKK